MNIIDVALTWRILESGRGKLWSFPGAVSPYMKKHYGGPSVYRWTVTGLGQDEPQLIYIGEAHFRKKFIATGLKPRLQFNPPAIILLFGRTRH